ATLAIMCSALTATPTPVISTLSLHAALPILSPRGAAGSGARGAAARVRSRRAGDLARRTAGREASRARVRRAGDPGRDDASRYRSEEHTSELQSLRHLVCRLLLGKKKEALET